jgi:phenylalanyl-tRNA synthetase beta chain
MKVLLSWLQEFFSETLTAQQVADALYRVGIEVESIDEMGKGLDKVVVAKIESATQHPNADKLTLCKVFNGTEVLDIVCGAKNFKVGDHVALAQIGAVLPGDFKIEKSKIRGEVSFGMLCSTDELGFEAPNNIGDPVGSHGDGIIILPQDSVPGTPLKSALKLDDAVLHLSLTPNRGDCFSILGVAIEVGAALNLKIKPPVKSLSMFQSIPMQVEIVDAEGCLKYSLQRIEGVSVGPSASLIATRLEKSGIRAVNNIVDLTNYMMLERGQPMHAFDADKVKGKIQIRRANEGEKIECLDEQTQVLNAKDLIIADEHGPLAIAGVMGGMRSAITMATKNIFLESAWFEPRTVRTTSRRLNLVSESSKRFERDIDPSTVTAVGMVTADMIEEHTNGKLIGGVDFDHNKTDPAKIRLTQINIQKILGIDIPNAGDYLSRLGFSLVKAGEGWSVEVPLRRPEIQREIDLIEEIARIHGYDNIPSKLPSLQIEPRVDSAFAAVEQLRQKVIAMGLSEARTYSFTSQDWAETFTDSTAPLIEVLNPLTPETSVMRNSLLPGLLESWKTNNSRQIPSIRLFEIGKTFAESANGAKESLKLAIVWGGVAQEKTWYDNRDREFNYYDAKGFLETLFKSYNVPPYAFSTEKLPGFLHPGQGVRISMAKKPIGVMGMIHPALIKTKDLPSPICVLEIDLELLLEMGNRKPKFASFSSFPKVERDLAMVMKKTVLYKDVLLEIDGLKVPFLTQTSLFDRFEGKNIPSDSASLAFRFVFQAQDKTLTDAEIEQAMGQIQTHLKAKFEASSRS